MPATFTRTPPETERRDPGIGGKPPVDRRPTGGGGDGENWEHRQPGRRGPRELLSNYRRALFFALTGDLMFFVALVSVFFARQSTGHITASNGWVMDWQPLSIPPILWINSAIILLSSLTVEIGRRQLFREDDVMEEWLGLGRPAVRRAAPWLIATAVLGLLFLGGQWIAWSQLISQRMFFSSLPSSDFFYLLTGSHGLHLIVGILGLLASIVAIFLLRRVETRQAVVDCAAWYWHAMGLLWFFLFGVLIFCQ